MSVTIYFFTAIAVLVLFSAIALTAEVKLPNSYFLTGRNIFIFGMLLSSILIMLPLYTVEGVHWIFAAIASVLHAATLFFFRPDFDKIIELWRQLPLYYMITVSAYHLIAPIISAAVILSFVKHFTSLVKYNFSFNKDVHIFSELNERTLALGKNLYEKYNKRGRGRISIVYTNVIYGNEKAQLDLIEGAKEIRAILFTKDVLSIRFKRTRKSKHLIRFYLISDNEKEKIKHIDRLIELYEHNEKAEVYIFSDSIEIKYFLKKCLTDKKNPSSGKPEIKMGIIRIDDVKLLIYHNLDVQGMQLFENATPLPDGTREISAVIVGFGKYGQEIAKALLWYCQLPGYRIRITVLDDRNTAESEFFAQCPEIRAGENINAKGDMQYSLRIRKASFGTSEFYSELEKIEKITHVFICLGTDNHNLAAATGIKTHLAQHNKFPLIDTFIYDTYMKECLISDGSTVHSFGDLREFYSENALIAEPLIDEALQVHMRWAKDPDDPSEKKVFYMSDYHYYSSLASALHRRLLRKIKDRPYVFPFYTDDPISKEILPYLVDNEGLKTLSRDMRTFADCLYIKIAYQKYLELSVEQRRKVLIKLQNSGTAESVPSLPMYLDRENYVAGYGECLSELRFDDPSAKETVKLLRNVLNCIIDMQTEGIEDEARKREIIHSFEFDALTEQQQSETIGYVCDKLGLSPDEIKLYFARARWFANLEHIRWNAYMRTEGFCRSIKTDRANKLHYDLVPSNLLTFADCIKDI